MEVNDWVDEPDVILETLAEHLKEEHGFDFFREYNAAKAAGEKEPVFVSEWETDYFEDGTILIDNKPVTVLGPLGRLGPFRPFFLLLEKRSLP